MLFYVSVAVGGALGSVARAWLAVAVARLAGPEFPWGTILINIIGSFVIGFFGTLTASDGRFAVPTDLRAFVMIGICGGFTTFSSFSLQTLELARDGRVAQAAGNVVLSVVLCLVAVTAGHFGAAGLRGTHLADRGGGQRDGVVTVLDRPETARDLLRAGAQLLAHGMGGRLKAVAMLPAPAAALLPSEEVMTADRDEARRAGPQHWEAQIREAVAEQATILAVDWLQSEGDGTALVRDLSQQAEIMVMARPVAHEKARMRACLHAALFDTAGAVLLVPPGFAGFLGEVVAIAWREDGRAEKSVRASLGLLRQAREIHVLSADAPPAVPAVLLDAGLSVRLHAVDGTGPVGARLLKAADSVRADLLIMGAYAQPPWHEAILGGTTRHVMAHAQLPVLLKH